MYDTYISWKGTLAQFMSGCDLRGAISDALASCSAMSALGESMSLRRFVMEDLLEGAHGGTVRGSSKRLNGSQERYLGIPGGLQAFHDAVARANRREFGAHRSLGHAMSGSTPGALLGVFLCFLRVSTPVMR